MPPHPALPAEAIAWPLVDPAGWAAGDADLSPTALLPGFEARAPRFGESGFADRVASAHWRPEPLTAHLARHAQARLRITGAVATLIEDRAQPGREVQAWRWLSLTLPASLLLAAATPPDRPAPASVRLLIPQTAPEGPVAHLHLHAGAVAPLELVWVAMGLDFDATDPHEAAPEGVDGQDWADRLLAAHLARRLLAARWTGDPGMAPRGDPEQHFRDLCAFLLPPVPPGKRGTAPVPGVDLDRSRRVAWRRALWTRTPPGAWASKRAVLDRDPLGGPGVPDPEARFLLLGLRRSAALAGSPDPEHQAERRLFAQYLRVRVAMHRVLVMDPTTRGLGHFVKYYDAIRRYRGRLEPLAPDLAARSEALDLRALEVRTAPPDSIGELLDLVAHPTCWSKEANAKRPVEWSWTLHFVRDKPKESKNDRRRNGPLLVQRWRDAELRARTLERALRRWPGILRVMRALDVAGDELAGPLWLFLPLLHRVRATSEAVAARAGQGLEALRMTLHAGEDFAHSYTGLRHVDACLSADLLRTGDRVGHAVVLGAELSGPSPAEPVYQPRRERLLDLAWLLSLHRAARVQLSAGEVAVLEAKAVHLGQVVLGSAGLTVDDLVRLHEDLQEPDTLPRIQPERRFRLDTHAGRDRWVAALLSRWDHPEAAASVPVDAGLGWEACAPLQAALRERLAALHVTVEVNPSSNLVVAGFNSVLDQPMFRLSAAKDKTAVPISISADDPISFATNLDDEFAYALAALSEADSPAFARKWLDDAAQQSFRARFTVPESARLDDGEAPSLVLRRRWRTVG